MSSGVNAGKPVRDKAEILLAESQIRYRAIFETVVDGIITIDQRGRIDSFNPAAERIFGYSAGEVIGRNVSLLMPEPDHSAHDGYLANYLHTGHTGVIGIGREVTGRRKDGSTFPMDLAVAEKNIAGERRFNGIVRDISEQRRVRQQLQRFSSEMQAIFTLSPDGFVAFDERGQLIHANPAFLALSGLLIGTLQGVDADELDRRLVTLCEAGHVPAPVGAMPDGASDVLRLAHPRPVVLKRSVRCIQGEDGRNLGRVLYFRDISNEMELHRMKSEFLATAAHELRTPLASILGFTELLMSQDYDAETRRDLLETIQRQSSKLVGLVGELLDLARIEARAGKDFNIRAQALWPIIDATVRHLMVPGDLRRISLKLADGLPAVMVDADKLEQALLNVLANAYKYSPSGGAIEIGSLVRQAISGLQVGITVTDHGIGMTFDVAERVGERFYRADHVGDIPGAGLGLSLVKEILDIHRGELQIESRLGEGTTVTLWLPTA